MCELDILHDSLYQFCPELHLKRLNSLTLACHALLDCKTLTLTELGRNLPTKARTKHNIKRIDRLLGNRHLHKGVSLDIENYCTLRLFFDLSTLAGLSRRNLPEAGIRLLFQI